MVLTSESYFKDQMKLLYSASSFVCQKIQYMTNAHPLPYPGVSVTNLLR